MRTAFLGEKYYARRLGHGLAVAILALGLTASAAFAANNAQDDKNNPTFPGTGVGRKARSGPAVTRTLSNCSAFFSGQKGNGTNLPAQCYVSPR